MNQELCDIRILLGTWCTYNLAVTILSPYQVLSVSNFKARIQLHVIIASVRVYVLHLASQVNGACFQEVQRMQVGYIVP